jgi:alpha-tubulin suppressor-like RCC1 family protein
MSVKRIEIFKNFSVLTKLNNKFRNEIKIIFFYKESNLFIITNDDKVFVFGNNDYGDLGFGNLSYGNNNKTKLTLNEELSYKQFIDFKHSLYHITARTIDGEVYCWGCNENGVLGNGKNDSLIYKPELNQYLIDKQIIDICCGSRHTLVLTDCGEVYAWGYNEFGQIGNERRGRNECQSIPIKVSDFNDEKVIQISCGFHHSIALTENGHVFSWGRNNFGQLCLNNTFEANKPSIASISKKIPIKKISCGHSHSLLLSSDGNIFCFGNNEVDNKISPKILTINRFIDIASHYDYEISIALSVNGTYFVWGICGEEKIKEPKETEFKSFDEIFIHYYKITHKVMHINSEKAIKENKSEENVEENPQIESILTSKKIENLSETSKQDNNSLSKPSDQMQNSENNKDFNEFITGPLNYNRYKCEFEEKELIGIGGFGEVYKVINRLDQQQYAVKMISFKGDS